MDHSLKVATKADNLVFAANRETLDEQFQWLLCNFHLLPTHRATSIHNKCENVIGGNRRINFFLIDLLFIVDIIYLRVLRILRLLGFKCWKELGHHRHQSFVLIRSLENESWFLHVESAVEDVHILLHVSVVAAKFVNGDAILALLCDTAVLGIRNFLNFTWRFQIHLEIEVKFKIFITIFLTTRGVNQIFSYRLAVCRVVSRWEHEVKGSSLDLQRLNNGYLNLDRLPRHDVANVNLMEVKGVFALL